MNVAMRKLIFKKIIIQKNDFKVILSTFIWENVSIRDTARHHSFCMDFSKYSEIMHDY